MTPLISTDSHTLVAGHETYQAGDLIVSTSDLQWRLPDGTLNLAIDTTFNGGTGFGADGSLYLTEFQYGSRVEKYDNGGRRVSSVTLGSCQDPASVQTDSKGNVYFGSGGNLNCTYKYITKFGPADNKIADYTPASDSGWEHGPGWIAIEGDDCTFRYTTGLSTVRRYNVCTSTQLPNFSNSLSQGYGLAILPDGGMIVANWTNIVRLNASGQVIRTYDAPSEQSWTSVALSLDGTAFWAGSADNAGNPPATNIVHKFDVASGSELASFNTGATGGVWGLTVFNPDPFLPPSVTTEQTFGGPGGSHGARPFGFRAEPVNTATGSYISQATDISMPGRGMALTFRRTYNSADPTVGVLGQGWTHRYAVRVQTNGDGSVLFVDEGGAQLLFTPNGSGGFIAPIGSGDQLTSVGGGQYQLKRRDQVVYLFDASGNITSLTDRNGNALTFSYAAGFLSTITDTVGRQVGLSYTGGRLTGLSGPMSQTVTYGYDGSGRLSSVVDVRGKTWTYTYDPGGRMESLVDPNNHAVVTNTYGPDGRVIEQVDSRNFHTTYGWDAASGVATMTDARGGVWSDTYHDNVLVSRTDPLGNLTRYVYDDALNTILVTNPRGFGTSMTYDVNRNLLTQTPPGVLGYPAEVWTYNARNDVTSHKDSRGNTSTFTYTPAGNVDTVTGPAPVSPAIHYTYVPAGTGLVASATDPRGKITTYGYDSQANRNRVTTPLGNVTTSTFDGLGRMVTMVEPRGNVAGADPLQYTSTFTYDQLGNNLTTTDALNHTTTQTYDPVGNLLTAEDANHHVTTLGYDAANHLASVTDARNKTTAYGYDQVSNLVSRTDANTHVTNYAYDLARRPTSTTDPLTHAWTTTYDAAGNPLTKTDANNKTTTYVHDALNRLTKVTYADTSTPTVTLGYDANGNQTSMIDGAGTETYVIDTLNRMTSATRGTAVFTYGYDAAGNVTSRTYPGQTAQAFVYDDDSRVTSGNGATYTYDPSASVLTAATPDGFTARYTYDRAGRLLETAHTRSTGTLSRFTYAVDPAGNRTAMTTRQGTVTYRYDELDRLTEACWSSTSCPGGPPAPPASCLACVGSLLTRPVATVNPPAGETYRTYGYDSVGNRMSEGANAGVTTYAYDAADRLTAITVPGSGVNSYTFDNNGNQTAAGSRTFTFDLADRLKTATVGTTIETYTYAGDGTRLSASTGSQANKTTKSLWDRSFGLPQLAIERNGNDALLRTYRYGLDRISQVAGSSTYFYHPDGLGSVSDVTSSAGASLTWSEYYPYGVVRQAGTGTKPPAVDPFRFTGEELDSVTGLYYLRARQYDPGTGRFLSADPAKARVGDPFVSAYVYVNNRPTRATDPSGKICVEAIPIGAGIGTLAEPGGGTIVGAGAGTAVAAGCAVVVVGAVVITAVAAWIGGSKVGEAIVEAAKPPPPIYDPRTDPETVKAILELVASLTPDIHTGLPGGGFPAWCKAHPATCKGAVLIIGTLVTWAMAQFGGVEGMEEAAENGPEDRENGK